MLCVHCHDGFMIRDSDGLVCINCARPRQPATKAQSHTTTSTGITVSSSDKRLGPRLPKRGFRRSRQRIAQTVYANGTSYTFPVSVEE